MNEPPPDHSVMDNSSSIFPQSPSQYIPSPPPPLPSSMMILKSPSSPTIAIDNPVFNVVVNITYEGTTAPPEKAILHFAFRHFQGGARDTLMNSDGLPLKKIRMPLLWSFPWTGEKPNSIIDPDTPSCVTITPADVFHVSFRKSTGALMLTPLPDDFPRIAPSSNTTTNNSITNDNHPPSSSFSSPSYNSSSRHPLSLTSSVNNTMNNNNNSSLSPSVPNSHYRHPRAVIHYVPNDPVQTNTVTYAHWLKGGNQIATSFQRWFAFLRRRAANREQWQALAALLTTKPIYSNNSTTNTMSTNSGSMNVGGVSTLNSPKKSGNKITIPVNENNTFVDDDKNTYDDFVSDHDDDDDNNLSDIDNHDDTRDTERGKSTSTVIAHDSKKEDRHGYLSTITNNTPGMPRSSQFFRNGGGQQIDDASVPPLLETSLDRHPNQPSHNNHNHHHYPSQPYHQQHQPYQSTHPSYHSSSAVPYPSDPSVPVPPPSYTTGPPYTNTYHPYHQNPSYNTGYHRSATSSNRYPNGTASHNPHYRKKHDYSTNNTYGTKYHYSNHTNTTTPHSSSSMATIPQGPPLPPPVPYTTTSSTPPYVPSPVSYSLPSHPIVYSTTPNPPATTASSSTSYQPSYPSHPSTTTEYYYSASTLTTSPYSTNPMMPMMTTPPPTMVSTANSSIYSTHTHSSAYTETVTSWIPSSSPPLPPSTGTITQHHYHHHHHHSQPSSLPIDTNNSYTLYTPSPSNYISYSTAETSSPSYSVTANTDGTPSSSYVLTTNNDSVVRHEPMMNPPIGNNTSSNIMYATYPVPPYPSHTLASASSSIGYVVQSVPSSSSASSSFISPSSAGTQPVSVPITNVSNPNPAHFDSSNNSSNGTS